MYLTILILRKPCYWTNRSQFFFCRNCIFAIKVNTGWIHESYNNCFLYLFYNTCASINLIVLYSNLIDIQLHCTVVWQNNAVQNLFFVLPNFIFRFVFMRHSNVTPRRDLGSVIQVRIKNANFSSRISYQCIQSIVNNCGPK